MDFPNGTFLRRNSANNTLLSGENTYESILRAVVFFSEFVSNSVQKLIFKQILYQCSRHVETSQIICSTSQVTGFYIAEIFVS